MSESDLYPPVRDWLRARGYEVHAEVFGADIVAVKDGQLTVVELKVAFTMDLCNQLADRARWADFVFAAVPDPSADTSKGKLKLGFCENNGFGVLTIKGGKVRQRKMARPQPWGWHKRRTYRLKELTGRPEAMEHELAGLPSCAALREQRLLRLPARRND